MIDPAEEQKVSSCTEGDTTTRDLGEMVQGRCRSNLPAPFITNSEFDVSSTITVALYVTSTSDSIVKVKSLFSVSY